MFQNGERAREPATQPPPEPALNGEVVHVKSAMFESSSSERSRFDDVPSTPGCSQVLPAGVDVRSRFARNIALNIALIGAVTEVRAVP
jgi:IMP dehydrogenase/GMP reductase